MADEPATATYSIPEPFDRALKHVRQVFAANELSIASELDASGRIHRELGVRLNTARILYVDCPVLLLEAMALHAPIAVFMPLHVVVSDRGGKTEVHFLNSLRFAGAGIPAAVRVPIYRLQARIAGALQKIGMPQGVCHRIYGDSDTLDREPTSHRKAMRAEGPQEP